MCKKSRVTKRVGKSSDNVKTKKSSNVVTNQDETTLTTSTESLTTSTKLKSKTDISSPTVKNIFNTMDVTDFVVK